MQSKLNISEEMKVFYDDQKQTLLCSVTSKEMVFNKILLLLLLLLFLIIIIDIIIQFLKQEFKSTFTINDIQNGHISITQSNIKGNLNE